MHIAAKLGHQNIVKMLIDSGADLTTWDMVKYLHFLISPLFQPLFIQDGKRPIKLAEEGTTTGHRQAAEHLKTAAAKFQMQIVDYHFEVCF